MSRHNHEVIRHAYEGVLTACARLASFASGSPTLAMESLIDARQDILVIDDLMSFAINARRLMENTISLKQSTTITADVMLNGSKTKKPITRIINILIHHRDIKIFRSSAELKIASGNWKPEDILHKNIKSFLPIVMVMSDRKEYVAFKLWDLMQKFETDVLNLIVETCAEEHLFLDEEMFRV